MMRPRRRSPVVAAAASAGVAVLLAACSPGANTVAQQALAGDGKGYVAGDGSVQQLKVSERTTTVSLSGTTIDGKTWSMAQDAPGKVVVVNVWGSWCPPCVEEAPQLEQAWKDMSAAGKPVAFIGVDIKESSATALAFVRAKGITYPSLSDGDSGGQPMLALQGKAAAVPTTLVLDTRGRVAARVLGPTTAATLTALVDDVLAEQA